MKICAGILFSFICLIVNRFNLNALILRFIFNSIYITYYFINSTTERQVFTGLPLMVMSRWSNFFWNIKQMLKPRTMYVNIQIFIIDILTKIKSSKIVFVKHLISREGTFYFFFLNSILVWN